MIPRVRFAPSPTGVLHIGGLRTALYNYLVARGNGGTFILRIEDTDRDRLVQDAEADILSSLEWAGLRVDEGPGAGGPHAPYRQSERSELYASYALRLVDAGHAYYAFDSADDVANMRARLQDEANPSPRYDARTRGEMTNSLTLTPNEVTARLDSNAPFVVRLLVRAGESVSFEDKVRGTVSFRTDELDDQVLLKSDGMPTYHLANVVDDHLMGITHVIRGEEWLPSTPKHVLLYRYLEWDPPEMAHLPLILSPSGGKLSKRNADALGIPVAVRDFRRAGYEPAALLNFLAFLGWNPGTDQEVFTLEELASAFSLERVGSGGVQFNLDKLNWYNQQFLRRLSDDQLVDRIRPHVERAGYAASDTYLSRVGRLLQDRITFAHEVADSGAYFLADPDEYEEAGIKKRWKPDSGKLLGQYADRLAAMGAFDAISAEGALRSLAEELGVGAGRIIHPTRLALSGVSFGPGLFEMMDVLGKEVSLRRMRLAVERLG